MTISDGQTWLKLRLDIDASDDTFDNLLQSFLESAIKRIFPRVASEVAPQEVTPTITDYQTTIDLNTLTVPVDGYKRIEAVVAGIPHTDFSVSKNLTTVTIWGVAPDVDKFIVYGLMRYSLATLPTYYEQGLLWYCMSEFYTFLVGNRRKFNEYMQNGTSTVDEMQDLAEMYEQKAKDFLDEQAPRYVRQ